MPVIHAGHAVAAYITGVFRGTVAATDHMPAGLHLYLP